MAFDPDAYLAGSSAPATGFDPDAYLATPSTALDVAKQIGSGLVTGVEAIPAAPAHLLGALGNLVEKYVPGMAPSPEQAAKRQELKDLIAKQNNGGMAQYLPKPETTAGEFARTAAEFLPSAAVAPGSLARNLVAGGAAGLTSEAGGQLMKGTALEPYARLGGALIGGPVALKAEEAMAARSAAKTVPTAAAIEDVAKQQYQTLRNGHVAQPIAQAELDALAADVRSAVNRSGPRPSVAASGHSAIDEIKLPATKGAPDVADLVTSRQNMKEFLRNPLPDPNKAVAAIAIPKIDAAIERLSPGTVKILREADANYSAAKTAQTLDKKIARAELRAAGENSGLNLGNKIRQKAADMLLSGKESKGLTAIERQALEGVVRGTLPQNLMRLGSNLLGGGGGLGSTLLGATALGGGAMTGHPEAGLLPFAGLGLRMLTNRSVANQAAQANALIRSRSPLAQQMPSARAVPTPLTRTEMGLLSALFAAPAMRGILPIPDAAR